MKKLAFNLVLVCLSAAAAIALHLVLYSTLLGMISDDRVTNQQNKQAFVEVGEFKVVGLDGEIAFTNVSDARVAIKSLWDRFNSDADLHSMADWLQPNRYTQSILRYK